MELVLQALLKPAETIYRVFFLGVLPAATGERVMKIYVIVLDKRVIVEQRKVTLGLQ